MNNINQETTKQIIQSFLMGYSLGSIALRVRNNPPITMLEANIIETIDSLTSVSKNINSVIAASIAASESSTTVTINNLEKKGYVSRLKGTKDRRNQFIRTTEKCSNVLHSQTQFHQDHQQKLLSTVNPEELSSILNSVTILNNYLTERILKRYRFYQPLSFNYPAVTNTQLRDKFYSIFVHCFYLMGYVQEIIIEELKSDITITELIILKTILGYETQNIPVSNGLIAFALKVTNPTISLNLKRLEAKNYIRRSFDKKDRRSIIINITAKARKLIDNNLTSNIEIFDPILNAMNDKEKALFYSLFLNMRDFFLTLKF
jgi:DNA-binding MarR family transcriptional regulator